ncbi:MarR family winged helix-turn-helix transcriptional regulator [Virgibacillus proomii]|uniref:MarR family winged helix-turn-helix transcriptional regulator n=1 Tax=Virgibacillus proomii TaxID=84407 RepID=UPI000984B7DF|nr:MarR family transcriptional regulator [Virgibacillus proomii]
MKEQKLEVLDFGYLLMNAAKQLRYMLNQALSNYEVTSGQWAILKQLQYFEENTQRENCTSIFLSTHLGFDKPTISGMIRRLEEKELVIRVKHSRDKRSFFLQLTPKAYRIIPQLEKISEQITQDYLSIYTEEEKRKFYVLLEQANKRSD